LQSTFAPRDIAALFPELAHGKTEVGGFAHVVDTLRLVDAAVAGAENQGDHVPADGVKGLVESGEIKRIDVTFEAVQQQHPGLVRVAGVEVHGEFVAIGRVPDFLVVVHGRWPAEHGAPDGLGVAIAQPPRGAEGELVQVREDRLLSFGEDRVVGGVDGTAPGDCHVPAAGVLRLALAKCRALYHLRGPC
jgi:hypothetical protein